MPTPTDRNLLFGILALQMDFISRDQLVSAMNAWVLDKAQPLAALLEKQQALSAERRALLDALVAEHLRQHGNDDAHQSLAAVSSASSVRAELERIADPDLHASLARVGAADPMAGKPTIGDYIRTVRESLDWTQPELARRMGGGVAPQRVSEWENGSVIPKVSTLQRLARALGIDLIDLVELSAGPSSNPRGRGRPPVRTAK